MCIIDKADKKTIRVQPYMIPTVAIKFSNMNNEIKNSEGRKKVKDVDDLGK